MKLKERFFNRMKLKNYSDVTAKNYWKWIVYFIRFNNTQPPEMLTDKINDYLTHLAVIRKLAPKSIRVAGCAIIFLYRKVLDMEIPYINLPRPSNRKLPVILSRDETFRLINALQGVDRLQAELMYACGLRVGEVCKLRVKDIDFENDQIVVDNGKGQKDRIVNLPDSLIAKLHHHIKKVELLYTEDLNNKSFDGVGLPDPIKNKYPSFAKSLGWQFMFPSQILSNGVRWHRSPSSIQRAMQIACKKIKLNKTVSCHTLRHSFATHLIHYGHNIRVVQELLGHKSLRTTQIYLHINDNDKREIDDLLGGRNNNVIKLVS